MGSEEMQENFHESSVIILPGVFFFLSGWMTSKTVCFARSNLLHIPHSNGNLGFPVRSQKPERLINQIAKNFPWLSSSQFNEIRGRKRGNYDELHKSDYITPAIISFRYQTVNSWTGQKHSAGDSHSTDMAIVMNLKPKILIAQAKVDRYPPTTNKAEHRMKSNSPKDFRCAMQQSNLSSLGFLDLCRILHSLICGSFPRHLAHRGSKRRLFFFFFLLTFGVNVMQFQSPQRGHNSIDNMVDSCVDKNRVSLNLIWVHQVEKWKIWVTFFCCSWR